MTEIKKPEMVIKDLKWEISVVGVSACQWIAYHYLPCYPNPHHYLSISFDKDFKSQKAAKRDWEQFAKENKIKNWKYTTPWSVQCGIKYEKLK